MRASPDHGLRPARPLEGRRIVLTRPAASAGDFATRIRTLGGIPLVAPAIATVPPVTWTPADAALRRLGCYDWLVFTSANAVRALLERADALDIRRETMRTRRLAVVGPATAAVIRSALRESDVVPAVHTGEELARALPDIGTAHILLPRGDLADDTLPAMLRCRGAFVDEVVVYRTVPGVGVRTIAERVRTGSVDALLFASASAVWFVTEATRRADVDASAGGATHARPVAICLGPVTAAAAREAGFANVVMADDTTLDALITCAARWFAQADRDSGGST